MIERTGIVEEGVERRLQYARFIDRAWRPPLGEAAVRPSKPLPLRFRPPKTPQVALGEGEIRERAKRLMRVYEVAAEITGVGVDTLLSHSRYRNQVKARHFAMWLSVKATRLPVNAAAMATGWDHSSMIYALQRVDHLRGVKGTAHHGWTRDPRAKELLR